MLLALLRSMNQVLVDVLDLARGATRLDSTIKVTGGMCSPGIIALKRAMFLGFDFLVLQNCSTTGNAMLAARGLGIPVA